MKIYTKTGDAGETSLFNGSRVKKHNSRVNLYGTVDELNSIIGIAISFCGHEEFTSLLQKLSLSLFNLGSDLATPLDPKPKFEVPRIGQSNIDELEQLIDKFDSELPKLKYFILPGGSHSASFLHQARTVCRRAERLATELSEVESLGDYVVKYLNRLSDFLFVAARYANKVDGREDIMWKP